MIENVWGIALYFFVINVVGFMMMIIDKNRAKRGTWRISENTLILIAFFGGALGMFGASRWVRHKTSRAKFQIGLPLLIIVQLILCLYLFRIFG